MSSPSTQVFVWSEFLWVGLWRDLMKRVEDYPADFGFGHSFPVLGMSGRNLSHLAQCKLGISRTRCSTSGATPWTTICLLFQERQRMPDSRLQCVQTVNLEGVLSRAEIISYLQTQAELCG